MDREKIVKISEEEYQVVDGTQPIFKGTLNECKNRLRELDFILGRASSYTV